MEFKHKSVLLDETINGLRVKPDGIYVDGTLGGAGHAIEVCRKLSAKGRFIGIDQDQDAIIAASERLAAFDQVTIIRSNYCYMVQELAARGIYKVDGILLDLGVSSYQLDNEERGFTYRVDAPLDMRMDATEGLSAWNVVNEWPEGELKRILYEYGEERYAPRIAGAIVRARAQQPIATTMELVDVIRSAMPGAALREKQHPAKRSFQAIRIAVNDELGAVSRMMQAAVGRLNPGGARDDGHRARQASHRGAAVRHQLPFPRGPDRQGRHRPAGAWLHLPARGTGMHLRLCADAAQRLPQADPAR